MKNIIIYDESFSIHPFVQFTLYSTGVFICYIFYGYILELIFTLDGMQEFGWFITWIQFFNYSSFAIFQLFISGYNIKNKIPLRKYVLIASLTVGTMGFSNSSMGYLNYPTQVIFKSCKLIPVMIGSVFILGKKYSFLEVLSCVLMSTGLIIFTLADTNVQPDFNYKGVILVCCSLFCDALIGNIQEGAMKQHSESSTVVVLYSYSIGFFFIVLLLLWTNTLIPGVQFSFQHPSEVYGRVFLLSVSGFCGVQIVLRMVAEYGALVAVTVTTFRKAISICLSFFLFTKPFTVQYVWGGLLVMFGIYLNATFKYKSHTRMFSLLKRCSQIYFKRFRYKDKFSTEMLYV